ncbi:hypothetical protein EV360DRAFT_71848 [Lentinula raphanica]|nr:hypothetical protein EV360DRAFT_71848 [Lentinula raphanica]
MSVFIHAMKPNEPLNWIVCHCDIFNTPDMFDTPIKAEDHTGHHLPPPLGRKLQVNCAAVKREEPSSPLLYRLPANPLHDLPPIYHLPGSSLIDSSSPMVRDSPLKLLVFNLKHEDETAAAAALVNATPVKVDCRSQLPLPMDSTPRVTHAKIDQDSCTPQLSRAKSEPRSEGSPLISSSSPILRDDPPSKVPLFNLKYEDSVQDQMVDEVDSRSQLLPLLLDDTPHVTAPTKTDQESCTPQLGCVKSELGSGKKRIIESIRALIEEERAVQLEQIAGIEGIRDVLALELKHREQYIFGLRQLLSDRGVTPPASPLLESQKHHLYL